MEYKISEKLTSIAGAEAQLKKEVLQLAADLIRQDYSEAHSCSKAKTHALIRPTHRETRRTCSQPGITKYWNATSGVS